MSDRERDVPAHITYVSREEDIPHHEESGSVIGLVVETGSHDGETFYRFHWRRFSGEWMRTEARARKSLGAVLGERASLVMTLVEAFEESTAGAAIRAPLQRAQNEDTGRAFLDLDAVNGKD